MGMHWLPYGLMHIQMYDCKYLYTTLGAYSKGNRDVVLSKIVNPRTPDQDKGLPIAYKASEAEGILLGLASSSLKRTKAKKRFSCICIAYSPS